MAIDFVGDLEGLLLVDPGYGFLYDLPERTATFTWTEAPPGYRRWQRPTPGGGPPYRFYMDRLELDATEMRARIYDLLWQAAKEHQKGKSVHTTATLAVDKLKEQLGKPVRTLIMSRATWRTKFVDLSMAAKGSRCHPPKPWRRVIEQIDRRRVVLLDSGSLGCVFGATYPEDVGVIAPDAAGNIGAAVHVGSVARITI